MLRDAGRGLPRCSPYRPRPRMRWRRPRWSCRWNPVCPCSGFGVEGTYGAVHTDLEIPYGRCTYLGGIRGEYSYTFSNIFASGRGSVQDVSLLFNLGVRF